MSLRGSPLISPQDTPKGLDAAAEKPERNISAELEIAFLVLLCSSNLEICAVVTSCVALYCQEVSIMEGSTDWDPASLTLARNYDAYMELCSPNFLITGMVAFQKRFRKCLGKMTKPSLGILTAWEVIFSRWSDLNRHILSRSLESDGSVLEQALMEWRNYSGFLASVGGCCIADTTQKAGFDDSMVVGLRWIDRMSPGGDGDSLLDIFLSQCLQLLFCHNLRIRENIRDVLGVELSSKLFPYLLQSLESALASFFESSVPESVPQSGALVLEQAALLLKAMVERNDEIRDAFFTADFESMCLNLAQYADNLRQDIAAFRVQIRVCHLCVSITQRRNTMNLGHAIRIRNQLLGVIFTWISRLDNSQDDGATVSNAGQREDEVNRHKRDLNRACLQALVNLTYRLPLQPLSDHGEVDPFEPKMQLFFEYFKRLLSLLEDGSTQLERMYDPKHGPYRVDEVSGPLDLTISALSNLLSANIDVGLKHALHMGYHENTQVRTAFLRVVCNILSQEADFERLSDAAMIEKYNILLEVDLL